MRRGRGVSLSQLLDHCLAGDPREAHGIGCDNMTAIIVKFNKAS
jgi:hypothetical protein